MTHLNLGPMSRSELDAHIRASKSPNYRPLPEHTAMSDQLDLPPTAAEIEAYERRIAARAARHAAGARSTSRLVRPVRALRQALLERKRGRGAPEEGVGVGAA